MSSKPDQNSGHRSKALTDVPDLVLDKIASFLNLTDLLSFSHTSTKLFNHLSSQESIWQKELVNENLDTDSPRLLKKTKDLEALFPVSCHSKRVYLLRQRIRLNLRSGRLQKVDDAGFGEFILMVDIFRAVKSTEARA